MGILKINVDCSFNLETFLGICYLFCLEKKKDYHHGSELHKVKVIS